MTKPDILRQLEPITRKELHPPKVTKPDFLRQLELINWKELHPPFYAKVTKGITHVQGEYQSRLSICHYTYTKIEIL